MRDPFAWSFSIGRLFGITVRIHILFIFVALVMILRPGFKEKPIDGAWIDAAMVCLLLWVSVLVHEFGHCFSARRVGGDAQEVLLWPLGGLAKVDVPHTPRANFLVAAAGPAVNIVLCLLTALLLGLLWGLQPSWDLSGYPGRDSQGLIRLTSWAGEAVTVSTYSVQAWLTRLFWVNWILSLLNLILVGFPMDMGRMFQAVTWHYVGYRRATLAAVFAGFVTMFIVALYAILKNDLLLLCLGIFIYQSCKQEWIILETGGEEGLFGYDFSQGYTSLERDEPTTAPPRPRTSWWQRWQQRRAARKIQKEQEQREADERRMDELLDKVAREGINSLTDEEHRFMKRVSDRYRNRP